MRNSSELQDGYKIYAVSGTNTISFAIDFRNADTKGLLGFGVKRFQHISGKPAIEKEMEGYKVFKDTVKNAGKQTKVSTMDFPVQSFYWDDFTCAPGASFTYYFYPIKGSPEQLDRTLMPIAIDISTETLFGKKHNVFFNRGVASSQAYNRKFHNLRPDLIKDPTLQQKAYSWLSRDLDIAILKFVNQAQAGDTLLGCFYEFHFKPVLEAFKAALDRGVKVKLIIDCKNNASINKETGEESDSFPRLVNLKALEQAKIPLKIDDEQIVFQRCSNKNNIQHNKFIVLNYTNQNKKSEVWTGSTNISSSGFRGQTNVGHWIKDHDTAKKFELYWELLSQDPGKADHDDAATGKTNMNKLRRDVETLHPNFEFSEWDDIPDGITPVFSPRTTPKVLKSYAKMFSSAENFSCITLAFGINKVFKDLIKDNSEINQLSFMLLEKQDVKKEGSKDPFVYVGARQNVYSAWGSYIKDPIYDFVREVSARDLKLSKHVAFIHSKFLLVDPLGPNPVIVTGSANFSDASTNSNDENMIIIKGDRRTADIYFTEFNRLFNHYYFRAVYNNAKKIKKGVVDKKVEENSLFLSPNDEWLTKYEPGKLRYKRLVAYAKMAL